MKGRNQKVLLIVLVGLTAAFVLTKLFRSPSRESNLDTSSLRVDTVQITEVKLYPVIGQRKEIRLIREANGWKASHENISARADKYPVTTMLSSLAELKPQRIVTRKPENWDEYEVGDTTGVKVTILNSDEVLAVMWVGKESSGTTFIRRDGQPEVFAANGNLLNTFNKKFSDWRDKSFLKLKPDSVMSIEFTYPGDSSYVAKKNSSGWIIGESLADSVKVVQYLGKCRARNLYEFVDNFNPEGEPQFSIRFTNGPGLLAGVKAWKSSDDKLILTSTVQEGVYFSANALIMRDLFPSKRAFFSDNTSAK